MVSSRLVIVSIGTCLNDSIFLLPEDESPDMEVSVSLLFMLELSEKEPEESADGDVAFSSTTTALSSGVLQALKKNDIEIIKTNLENMFFIIFFK